MYEYWKTQLGLGSAALYAAMERTFSAMGGQIPLHGDPPDGVRKTYGYYLMDHPEQFWLSSTTTIVRNRSLFSQNEVFRQENLYSPSEVAIRQRAMAEAVQEIRRRLPPAPREFDIEKEVVDYLLSTVSYEINDRENQNASSALYARRAQCSGISRAAKYLFDALGVVCLCVDGTAKGGLFGVGSHEWNMVRIDGVFYHLDITFIMGANTDKKPPFRYPYFNITDAEAEKDHFWERNAPVCNTTFRFPTSVGGSGGTVISSLYEFRQRLTAKLSSAQGKWEFLSCIVCDSEEELMKILSQACRKCLEQTGLKRRISISITDGKVELHWQNNVGETR